MRSEAEQLVRLDPLGRWVVITLLVGIGRVYLGVHWPTDVLAGWTLGGAWAVLFWLVAMQIDTQESSLVR